MNKSLMRAVMMEMTPDEIEGVSGGVQGDQTVMNSELAAMSTENGKLLQVQIALQRENQTFSSVSNSLKTKHDTLKNTISNVR
jgi:hypothetical protein